METVLGMGIPIFLLAVFELYYANRGFISEKAMSMIKNKDVKDQVKSAIDASAHFAAEKQNIFGIRVIAISMAVVGLGITFLGIMADAYSLVIIAVGILILLAALAIYQATVQSKQKEQNDEI